MATYDLDAGRRRIQAINEELAESEPIMVWLRERLDGFEDRAWKLERERLLLTNKIAELEAEPSGRLV